MPPSAKLDMHPTARPHDKLLELDGLRGLAIALVLGFHFGFDFIKAGPGSALAYALTPIRVMWAGVDLFFILSGFLITRVLIRERFDPGYFRVFYGRRACRILPLYLLMMVPFLAGIYLHRVGIIDAPKLFGATKHFWSYFFFAQNFEIALNGEQINFLSVSWSLAVEEQLYLILPLLVYACRNRLPALRLSFAGMCAIAIGSRWLFGVFSPRADTICYVLPITRLDAFAVGGLLAYSTHLGNSATATKRFIAWSCMAFGAIGLALVAHGPHWGQQKYLPIIAFFAGLFYLALHLPTHHVLRAALRLSALRWLGHCSFGIYLIHMPVLGLLLWANGLGHIDLVGEKPQWITLLALAVTLGLAQLSRIYLEERMIHWGRLKWQYQRHT